MRRGKLGSFLTLRIYCEQPSLLIGMDQCHCQENFMRNTIGTYCDLPSTLLLDEFAFKSPKTIYREVKDQGEQKSSLNWLLITIYISTPILKLGMMILAVSQNYNWMRQFSSQIQRPKPLRSHRTIWLYRSMTIAHDQVHGAMISSKITILLAHDIWKIVVGTCTW